LVAFGAAVFLVVVFFDICVPLRVGVRRSG